MPKCAVSDPVSTDSDLWGVILTERVGSQTFIATCDMEPFAHAFGRTRQEAVANLIASLEGGES